MCGWKLLLVTTYWRNTIAHIPKNREDWRIKKFTTKTGEMTLNYLFILLHLCTISFGLHMIYTYPFLDGGIMWLLMIIISIDYLNTEYVQRRKY